MEGEGLIFRGFPTFLASPIKRAATAHTRAASGFRDRAPGWIFALACLFSSHALGAQAPASASPPPISAVPAAPTGGGQSPSTPATAARQSTGSTQTNGGANGTAGDGGRRGTNGTDEDIAATRARTRELSDASKGLTGSSAPPDPPTEFQNLVNETLGAPLPIFGASLFKEVPSTFAPVTDAPVPPDYVVGPGDELRIQVVGQVANGGTFTVDRTGAIAYPGVGSIHVAGIRSAELGPFLKTQLSRIYRNFELNVSLGQLRSIQVFVVGQARRPGAYTVSSLSTLLNALFASGGPLPQGSLRDIQVLRAGATVVHFDLYDLLLRGDKTKDVPLQPGDVLFIPTIGPEVALAGSVNNPAIYEIRPGTTARQLLALTGGRTSVALGGQLRIDRIYEHTMRSLVDLDLSRGDDPVLLNGDILSFGTVLARYRDTVTLRGNVQTPGRFVWHPGMRILDLVPDREALITRDFYRRLNALSNGVPDFYSQPGALGVNGTSTTRDTANAVQNGAASDSTQGGNSVAESLTGSNGVFPPVTDVILSAPDIDWSYAVVERLNRETLTTALIPFNPGRLYLAGDPAQNLALESGDVVTFFSSADLKVPTAQQTRFVRLEGEFAAAGVYSVEPGETLRHLLVRAGGFTPDAYLYGSEFTRQSTRRVQKQRLNEYADNLETQVNAFAASGNARSISAQDNVATNAAADSARTAIGRLRRTEPIGRVVLEVKPDTRMVEELPDLQLEDGDRFVVPRVPSTVSVEGQVYSSNAFVFVRGRHEQEYLRQAGGPDRGADRTRVFILRADGSVFSRQYGNVARATMFPGDTVVVPPQLARRAVLRDLLDISSVVGQFGLGAAAITLLTR